MNPKQRLIEAQVAVEGMKGMWDFSNPIDQKKLNKLIRATSNYLSSLSAFDRIAYSYYNITDLIGEELNTIIINPTFFIRWYRWCEKNDYDYTHWEGRQIIVDKDSPLQIGIANYPDQEIMKQLNSIN